MNFEEFVDISKLQALFDDLYDLTGVPAKLLNCEGRLLVQAGWPEVCVEFHGKNPVSQELCREAEASVKENIFKEENFSIYKCSMGLCVSSSPVIVSGRHLANVITGPVFHEEVTEKVWAGFREQAARHGFDEQTYLDAYAKIPVIPHQKHQQMLSSLVRFTEVILSMAPGFQHPNNAHIPVSRSEVLFRRVGSAVRDGLWQWNPEEDEIQCSDRCYEMLNYPVDSIEVDCEIFRMLLHPDDRGVVVRALWDAFRDNTVFDHDFRLRHADTSHIWVRMRGEVIEDEGTQLMVGTMTDVSDRIELQQTFEKAFQYSPAMMTITEISTGRYTSVNRRFLEVTGYREEDVLGHTSIKLIGVDEDERRKMIAAIQEKGEVHGLELQLRKANGEVFYCDYSGVIIHSGGEKYLLSLAVDITGKKHAEKEKEEISKQLRQAQKLEAIGTLAGGIAHDFNNILGAMIGYADMALEDVDPGSRTKQDLENVLSAGTRAKELVAQILTFSRQTESNRTVLRPVSIIKEAVKMLKSTLPATIRIQPDLDPDTGFISADPVQLHQVVMNICTNAFHAMEENGGVLTIRLHDAEQLPLGVLRQAERIRQEYLQLSIEDTGTGIDPSIIEKIFDPFFTTKEEGKGTGMGLSTVYGIIAEMEGVVTVDSRLGQGSVFHVFLQKLQMEDELGAHDQERIPEGTESILLVDDEVVLVMMVREKLERLGYRITGVSDSNKALEIFLQAPTLFDLVITDYTMPEMTGVELARRMMEVRPDIPIILQTGYSAKVDEEKALARGIKGFLYKPVLKGEMGRLVRTILDDARSGE